MHHYGSAVILRLVMPTTDRPPLAKALIGARLKVLRVALGHQAQHMAKAMGISPQAWSGWENGRELVDALILARASLRYGFTTDWVLTGQVARLPAELVAEIERRRPDLILGASPNAVPAPGWDKLPRLARKKAA